MGSDHNDDIPPPLITRSHDDDLDDDNDSDDNDFIKIDHYAMNSDNLFTSSNSSATPLYNYDDEGWAEDSENLFLHRFLPLPEFTYGDHFTTCSFEPHLYDSPHIVHLL